MGLLHDEHTAVGERVVDAFEHAVRVDLVVDRVEHEHGVEARRRREPRRVADLEGHVAEPGTRRLGAGSRDRALVEVVAHERRARERAREQHERVTGPARDVGDTRAGAELFGQPRHERKVCVDQQRVVGAAADGVHDVGELGPVRGVRNAATFAERTRDLVHVLAEMRLQQRHRREVRGAVGQTRGPLGRERVRPRRRVVLEDPTGDHGREPLADVALGEPGPFREGCHWSPGRPRPP